MSIVLQSSGGGQITLLEPTTASNFTQTLPVATGTVMVSGNMPAFSAYQSSATTLTSNVDTKVLFQVEDFDTNNNFSSSRFTPTVAGYYLIACATAVNASAFIINIIYKNGTAFRYSSANYPSGNYYAFGSPVLIYLNGTTDYIELYVNCSSATTTQPDAKLTWISGYLVRTT